MIYRKFMKNAQSRREFMKTLSGATASALVLSSCSGVTDDPGDQEEPQTYAPRAGIPNPFVTAEGKPILVCVKGTDFFNMLSRGLEAIGGLKKLIKNNSDVFIKPNFVEKSRYPWITSPDSLCDIIQAVKAVTSGSIKVGEMSYDNTESVFQYLGLDEIVADAGGSLIRLRNICNVRRDSWDQSKPDYEVYADIYNAPVIIDTCVLKRHSDAGMTCAIKCNVGTITSSHTTGSREYMHYRSGDFQAELAEVAGLTNPDLNIVDARTVVTEHGPLFEQNGVEVDTDKIIICGDIVATDAFCARLLEEHDDQFKAFHIDGTLKRAEALGLGTSDLSKVEILEITV